MALPSSLPRHGFAAVSLLGLTRAFSFAAHSNSIRPVLPSLSSLGMSASETKETLPYGAWASPITAKFITGSSVGMASLRTDAEGGLFWLEGRSQEGGRQVRPLPSL